MKEKTNILSSKSHLLTLLREKQGNAISGNFIAKELGVSRVAVWKTVQSLIEAGYSIETKETGYLLDPKNEKDFLYPWEFGEKEKHFFHYFNTESTMDRARESAFKGAESGSVFTAEKQSAGRGRHGRTWVSKQGGLFFTVLNKPPKHGLPLTIADYTFFPLIMQIALVKSISEICGKKAYLRWPNDIYINNKKIAGITTEIFGEGDLLSWLTTGIGVNANNKPPSSKATSIIEITGNQLSLKKVLCKILEKTENIKKCFITKAAYSQGNISLASEWNSLSDSIGAKAVIFEPEKKDNKSFDISGKILARGIFMGIDPAGRCILKTNTEKGELYFNHGSVSMAILN